MAGANAGSVGRVRGGCHLTNSRRRHHADVSINSQVGGDSIRLSLQDDYQKFQAA